MKYYFIDLFCGAGGVTTGVHRAQYNGKNIAEVIACVNHDTTAIQSHEANHPEVLHYTEDIRTLDLTDLAALVQLTRLKDPDGVICLWASLECTNFSKAKGGLPRDADSRTLAEHLFRYIDALDPDMIWIENVEEFMSWGPLDDKGKPLSRQHGRDFINWTNAVQNHGYSFEHRILNAADYGAYTSRKRLFIQFAKTGIDIVWPQSTHGKKSHNDVFGKLKKWMPVRDVLNLNETGESIFIPGRIKSDKTYERIYHGLIKFVAGGKKEYEAFVDAFLLKYNSTGSDGNVRQSSVSVEKPAPTLNTQGRLNIVHPVFLTKYHSGKNSEGKNRNYSVEEPLGTLDTQNRFYCIDPVFIIQRKGGDPKSKLVDVKGPARTVTTTGGNQEVVTAEWLIKHYGGSPADKNISIDGPAGTITTVDGQAIVKAEFIVDPQWSTRNGNPCKSVEDPCHTLIARGATPHIVKAEFLSAYYGNVHNASDVESPCNTLSTRDRFVLVSPQFLMTQMGASKVGSVDSPAGTVQTNPKQNLITAEPFLFGQNYGEKAKSINDPAPTQTADRHHYYLMNPQWFNTAAASVEQPCFTIIARQDKAPASLVCAETGNCAIEVFETDMPHALLIKAFMVLYGIVDIKMRMLGIAELLRIQGFGDGYILKGTKTKQKWMLGNAVECNQARVLIEASYSGNIVNEKVEAA